MNKYNFTGIYNKGCILPDSKFTQINLRSQPSNTASVVTTLKQGEYANTSGYAYSSQVLTNNDVNNLKSKDVWIEVYTVNGSLKCYAHISVCTPYANAYAGNARATADNVMLTNMMLLQDTEIHKNLVLATKKLIEIKKANKISNALYLKNWNEIKSIYKNWQNRQNFVKNAINKGEVKSVRNYEDKLLMQLMSEAERGTMGFVISTTAAIIIIALIAATAVTITLLVQNALKPKYSESSVDLKRSKLLNQALDTLTPEQKQEVINDLEKQIDDAYNQGYKDGNSDTLLGNLKTLAIVGLAAFGTFKFMEYQENKKSKNPNTPKK